VIALATKELVGWARVETQASPSMNSIVKLVPAIALVGIVSLLFGCATNKQLTTTTTSSKTMTARNVPPPPAEGPDEGPIDPDKNAGARRQMSALPARQF
jgi:hypothetical protein